VPRLVRGIQAKLAQKLIDLLILGQVNIAPWMPWTSHGTTRVGGIAAGEKM